MKQILFLLCLLAGISAKAQSLTPEVISAFGGESNTNGIQLSFTGGEAIVSTIESANSSLSQGFIQVVEIKQVTGIETINRDLKIKIFPNPAQEIIQIEAKIPVSKIEIYSLQGILIKSQEYNEINNSVDISSLATGNYIVKIHTSEGVTNKVILKR